MATTSETTLPSVISSRTPDDRPLWFVASRGVAPGAYWPVMLDTKGMHCPCPRGVALEEEPLEIRDSCRHMRMAVAHENETKKRPTWPVNASMFVD